MKKLEYIENYNESELRFAISETYRFIKYYQSKLYMQDYKNQDDKNDIKSDIVNLKNQYYTLKKLLERYEK